MIAATFPTAIVSITLSPGAKRMARLGVIVRRLNSIENLGSMDVLCTDKTGTLTQGKIVLEKHLDAHGDPSEKVLHYGYLNSYHHTGLKNLLDEAILAHEELEERLKANEKYRKIDEIPFDFVRRRMSVVIEDTTGLNTLICKGAVEEVLGLCTRVEVKGEVIEVLPEHDAKRRQLADDLNGQGFRVIALAYKQMPGATDEPVYSIKDESDLILLGFLAFLDPPKDTCTAALKQLASLRVNVKILTGDNELDLDAVADDTGQRLGDQRAVAALQPVLGEAVRDGDPEARVIDLDERGVAQPGLEVRGRQGNLELPQCRSPDLLRVHSFDGTCVQSMRIDRYGRRPGDGDVGHLAGHGRGDVLQALGAAHPYEEPSVLRRLRIVLS